MAESDIYIVPQDQTVHTSLVNLSEAQQLAGYRFDAVLRYITRRRYKPTKHSVPSGSRITDHVSTEPIAFQLVGVLTPYNVSLGGVPIDTASVEVLDDIANSALELTRRKRDQFIQFADEKTLLTVVGDEFGHANMIITSISDPKTVGIGDSYELTVGFGQIRVPLSSTRLTTLVSEDADKLGSRSLREIAGR